MKHLALVTLFICAAFLSTVFANELKRQVEQVAETTTELPMVQRVMSEFTTEQPQDQQVQSGEEMIRERRWNKNSKNLKRQVEQVAETTTELPMVQRVMSELTTEQPQDQQLQSGQEMQGEEDFWGFWQ